MSLLLLFTVVCGATVAAQPDVELSVGGPVATPAAAVERVRALRRSGAVKGRPVVVAVRPGRYAVAEPIVLTDEDSGLHFVGCGFEQSVFDGGVRLPPFRKTKDGLWETEVADGLEFDQLWVNGSRAQRARTPNRFYLYMREQDHRHPYSAFFADKQDIAPLLELTEDERAQVAVGIWQSWDMGYGRIKSVDAENGRLELVRPFGWKLFHWKKTCPRYTLENFRAALDAPGEWFHDRKAHKLLYVPRPGEVPETSTAVVPVASGLVTLQGDRSKGRIVRDIIFNGIGFEHAAFRIPKDGLPSAQSACNISQAAVRGADAEGVVMENCRIAHVGAHGIWMRRGVKDAKFRHCLVEDLGAGGVYFGNGGKADLGNRENNSSFLEIVDCIIRHGGRLVQSAVGVWIGHAHDCTVEHNDIYDFFYTGVSSGWTWGYAETVTRNIRVNHNRIHHIGQGVLSDMAGFYSLGDHAGSEVCNNWVWEVNGYADNGSPAWGFYTDEGSQGILFRDNLVEKCRDGAIHQHYGKENVHSNNIYTTFRKSGVWRSRSENHVTMRVLNNVFWWQDPMAGTYRGGGGYESPKDMVVDGNLYWCATGAVSKTAFKGGDWEKWRQAGKDANGAIADPQFVGPEKGDWRLHSGSPALKMGFRPFDWRDSGVLAADRGWVAKASEQTWDAFEEAPKAPRYRLKFVSTGFEEFPVGPLRGGMDGGVPPFFASGGKAGGISFTDKDMAEGKRAIVLSDSPENSQPWCPHLGLDCGLETGTAVVRFAFKPVKDDGMLLELRDYDGRNPSYVIGAALSYAGGELRAAGKSIVPVPLGAWADIEIRLPLGEGRSNTWNVSVGVRGGKSVSREVIGDGRFRHLTHIDFMSCGKNTGVWQLDGFSLKGEAKQ